MPRQPILETPRLLLRPFRTADADDVQRLAGDRAVADTTLNIPHPYEDGMAEKWISNHRDWFEHREQAVFAITLRTSVCRRRLQKPIESLQAPSATGVASYNNDEWPAGLLIGVISLRIELDDQRAELGYWIGKAYWSHGYCTEAARAVLGFGFEQLALHRIYAHHFARNPASGRVMQKLGMIHEGRLRQHVKKWDAFEDLELYGILRDQSEGEA